VVEDFVVSYLNGLKVVTKVFLEDEPQGSGLYASALHSRIYFQKKAAGMVFSDHYEDKRFSELPKLIEDYTKPDLKKTVRKVYEDKLYKLIVKLMAEHRIGGDFKLRPYRDWEIQKVQDRIGELEKRPSNRRGLGIPP